MCYLDGIHGYDELITEFWGRFQVEKRVFISRDNFDPFSNLSVR